MRALSLLTMNFITHCLTPGLDLNGIRSFVGFGILVGTLAHRVLYPRWIYPRLYLNIFRGEPAISSFD